ncbi:MAG: hypothetical protein N4A50_01655 [Vallitalea sp.]|jgi:CBS domain containing-hemolysin-like protein|nr:hypothetical protein [Vallitalea sp.]
MKQQLRNHVAKTASYLEICIAAFTLISIGIFSVIIIHDLYVILQEFITGNFDVKVEHFLADALQIIIGIEFIKMLAKHTPSSAVEVLLFAIARKIIVEHNTMLDTLIGVVAIAILFATRKYLHSATRESTDGMIFNGGMYVKEVNKMLGTEIPENMGHTIAGFVYNQAVKQEIPIKVGCKINIDNTRIEVYSMDDELIKQVIVHK